MLLKHSGYYLLARGLPGIVNFLAIAIYTRMLLPDEYGRYALVIAGVGLFNVEKSEARHWDLLPTPCEKLAIPFRNMPKDELRISGFDVRLKVPDYRSSEMCEQVILQ